MTLLTLSKFDVAERQLFQAITLFFRDEDPVSIHTLSEAASQVFSDIGSSYGVKSLFRSGDLIKEEYQKEWFAIISKSRNFFKHADRDQHENHEFNSISNHFSLLDAVIMHTEIKKRWTPETILFDIWFFVQHPNLLRKDTKYWGKYNEAKVNALLPDPKDKITIYEMIKMYRDGRLSEDKVTLDYGLPT